MPASQEERRPEPAEYLHVAGNRPLVALVLPLLPRLLGQHAIGAEETLAGEIDPDAGDSHVVVAALNPIGAALIEGERRDLADPGMAILVRVEAVVGVAPPGRDPDAVHE